MRQRAPYRPVKLHMTGFRKIKPGYFLRCATSGATYLVQDARKSKRIRGRTNIDALTWPPDAVDPAAVVLLFTWNKRTRRGPLRSRKPKLRSSDSSSRPA